MIIHLIYFNKIPVNRSSQVFAVPQHQQHLITMVRRWNITWHIHWISMHYLDVYYWNWNKIAKLKFNKKKLHIFRENFWSHTLTTKIYYTMNNMKTPIKIEYEHIITHFLIFPFLFMSSLLISWSKPANSKCYISATLLIIHPRLNGYFFCFTNLLNWLIIEIG